MRRLPVYQKMIIIFIIMLSLIYLVSLALTYVGKKSLENQYLESVTTKADFYGDFLESHIYFIRTLQLQLFYNSDVEKLSFLGSQVSGYEEVALVNSINEQLNNLNSSSDMIVKNKVIVKSYKRLLPIEYSLNGDTDTAWPHFEKMIRRGGGKGLTIHDGKLYLLAMDKAENKISVIELSKKQLMKGISHIVDDKKDAGVILVDPSSQYILTNDQRDEELLKDIQSHERNQKSGSKTFVIEKDQTQYQVTKSEIGYLNMNLYTYIDKEELTENLSDLNKGYLLLSFLLLLVAISFSWSINRMIHQPLKRLVSLFKNYQESLNPTQSTDGKEGEFSYLYASFNDMTKRLDQSIKDNYENKLALQKSELKQLQSQINPHFLYNSFYNIYRLSKMNNLEQVSTLSQKLASYYQFITKNSQDDVAFEKEYKHALDYCTIQQIRFSNRIEFQASTLTEEMKPIWVPRLILQPIIENAFEHAFEHSRHGVLNIAVAYENEALTITIEDNGSLSDEQIAVLQDQLIHSEQIGETTGMFNVCNRIKLKFGDGSGLFASRSHLGGLRIDMIIQHKGG